MSDIQEARDHGLHMAELAADKAGDDWKAEAIEAFIKYAKKKERFTTEDVRKANENIHSSGDPRAWGHIAQYVKKLGAIEFMGYFPVSSSNGSAKVLWKSLIFNQPAKGE